MCTTYKERHEKYGAGCKGNFGTDEGLSSEVAI